MGRFTTWRVPDQPVATGFIVPIDRRNQDEEQDGAIALPASGGRRVEAAAPRINAAITAIRKVERCCYRRCFQFGSISRVKALTSRFPADSVRCGESLAFEPCRHDGSDLRSSELVERPHRGR